jgi:hypothetical protein
MELETLFSEPSLSEAGVWATASESGRMSVRKTEIPGLRFMVTSSSKPDHSRPVHPRLDSSKARLVIGASQWESLLA